MIQPLRRMHLGIFLACLLLLPVLFVAGLSSRHKPPGGAFHIELAPNRSISDQTAVFGGTKVHVRIVRNRENGPEWQLELSPESPLLAPDVLVYWSNTNATSDLPADAKLLGSYDPAKRYPLPPQAFQEGGQRFVILYSLGWKKQLGAVAILPAGNQQ